MHISTNDFFACTSRLRHTDPRSFVNGSFVRLGLVFKLSLWLIYAFHQRCFFVCLYIRLALFILRLTLYLFIGFWIEGSLGLRSAVRAKYWETVSIQRTISLTLARRSPALEQSVVSGCSSEMETKRVVKLGRPMDSSAHNSHV